MPERPVFDFGILFSLTLVFFGGVFVGAGAIGGLVMLAVGVVMMGGLVHVLQRQLGLCEACLLKEVVSDTETEK